MIFFRKYFRWIFPIFRIRSQLHSFILGYRMVGYGCALHFIWESGRNQLHFRWARPDELFCGSVMFRTSQIRTWQLLHICYQVIFSRKIWKNTYYLLRKIPNLWIFAPKYFSPFLACFDSFFPKLEFYFENNFRPKKFWILAPKITTMIFEFSC